MLNPTQEISINIIFHAFESSTLQRHPSSSRRVEAACTASSLMTSITHAQLSCSSAPFIGMATLLPSIRARPSCSRTAKGEPSAILYQI